MMHIDDEALYSQSNFGEGFVIYSNFAHEISFFGHHVMQNM
jgi:hypothetical protein